VWIHFTHPYSYSENKTRKPTEIVWAILSVLNFLMVGIMSNLRIYLCYHKTMLDKCKLKITGTGLIVFVINVHRIWGSDMV
jgi:hypothetical protein